MSTDDRAALQGWLDVCNRLAVLGDELFAETGANNAKDRVDGIAHLAEQALCWIGWSVFHADPRRPFFHRQNDLITQWGGPNADNIYRHARIDASRRYRIRGRMHSCEDFILAIRRGFMHQPTWGTVHEAYAEEFGISAGDEFELLLGGERPATGNWVPLPEGAIMVSLREYYLEWTEDEPAVLTIDCLDDDTALPAPRSTGEDLASRLSDAIAGVEHSLRNWNSYLDTHRAAGTDNVLAVPMRVANGLDAARYAFGFWNLADGEAVLIETDVPAARYWSFQLYELGTYELVDIVERQSTLNHRQISVDADGRVRIVISAEDPGIANWLDTGGLTAGQFTFRYFWSDGDPTFTSRVVAVAELEAELPPDTRRLTATERVAALAARRRHLAWRYRT